MFLFSKILRQVVGLTNLPIQWVTMVNPSGPEAGRSLPCSTNINPYPTAFPCGNGMVLHFYQQRESSTTKTVHKVINKGLKTYV